MQHRQLFHSKGAVTRAFALLAAGALSSATFCAAAQTAETSQADTQKTPVATQEVSSQETAKPVEATATKAPKIKVKSAQSADDYEASEEISEDLSVSYPVDI